MSVKRPMKPSTRQAISRAGILISPLLLCSLFSTVSLLPAVLVVGLGLFLELSRMRMRMFQFLEFFLIVWLTAGIATLSLHFVLGGLVVVPVPVDSLLASFRRHEAALDSNFQRRDWASDLPPLDAPLRSLSVVINAHNEQPWLVRTLDGVLSTTGSELLEVIVIDDGSEPPLLPLVQASDTLKHHLVQGEGEGARAPLIHVVRHSGQEGLIRSKIHGASLASGDIVVFLDAHVKPFDDWTTPLFRHMNHNNTRLVAPVIPVLTEEWKVKTTSALGIKMMFDWAMDFNWFDDLNWPKPPAAQSADATLDAVPVLSGGLFGISRRWWFESGEYDAQMLNYGAENIEQSLRVWLCGGEITVARDSRIAHLFRPKFPYKVDDRLVMINKARTVKVWFNDPQGHPDRTGEDAVHLSDWQEKVMQGDPNIRGFMPLTGDVSERMKLRRECRDFQWYVERFRHVFEKRGLLDKQGALVKPQRNSEVCLSGFPVKVENSDALKATFVECERGDPLQNVQANGADNRVRVKSLCLDANAGQQEKLGKAILWFHCDFGKNANQDWRFVDGKLKWSGSTDYCATEVNKELVMASCASATTFTIQSLL